MKFTFMPVKWGRLLVALCMVSCLSPAVSAQQPNAAPPAIESMSLQQATDWLQAALTKNSSRYELNTNRLTNLEQVRFEGCSLKYIETIHYDDLGTRQRKVLQMEIALNLSDIDPATVRLMQMTGFWAVAYRTIEHKLAITRQLRMPGQSAKKMDMYYFPFQKPELGEPVAQAFAQAIKQCPSHQ